MIVSSSSAEETFAIGSEWGRSLPLGSVVAFFGDLGAGKTTFIKGLVAGATEDPSLIVTSPTFVLLNIYEGVKRVYHFDLYRLQGSEEFLSLGFEEYWNCPGITCIEWAERIAPLLPPGSIQVRLTSLNDSIRTIEISHE